MFGSIYKITNIRNNKIYIGKTTKTLKERLSKHFSSAKNLKTHLARAIIKYGSNSFKIDLLQRTNNLKELNNLETKWILSLNSNNPSIGYNLTLGGDGGNTYKYKTEKELKVIKEKLHNSKMGDLNPNCKSVKIKNVFTQEEKVFKSFEECKKFFNASNHSFISRRCQHKTLYLYKGKWLISYFDDEYIKNYKLRKNICRSKTIYIKENGSDDWLLFPSYMEAERFFCLKQGTLSKKAYLHRKLNKIFVIKNYQIKEI